MRNLLAFPILAFVVILQTAVVSRISLLSGFADLMLVTLAAWAMQGQVTTGWHWAVLGSVLVAFTSGIPGIVPLAGYLAVVGMAQMARSRIWQAPLLALFSIVFLGTLVMNLLAILVLRLLGNPLSVGDAIGLVMMPSLLLNLLFSIPMYWIMRDLARWMYPVEEVE